jgi:NAD(P)-dependent dehydrogenase (short-subunit alcohol dehydrogenase family)
VQSFENFFLIKNEFGHLDILFANAGIAKFSPIEETLEKDFDDVLRTNVTAVFLTVQAALALMGAGASIILNGSMAATIGSGESSAYAASKAGVRAMCRIIAETRQYPRDFNRLNEATVNARQRENPTENAEERLFPFAEHPLAGPACRRHLLGARHRRDLLRGVAGLRLRRLSRCVAELPVNVLASFPELIDALPQASRQVRQLFRPKQDEHNEEDDK